jgi:hypothetical protein
LSVHLDGIFLVVLAAYGLRLTNKAPELSGANFGEHFK